MTGTPKMRIVAGIAISALLAAGCGRQSPSGPLAGGRLRIELRTASTVNPTLPAPLGGPNPPYNAFDSLHVAVFVADPSAESQPLAEIGLPLIPGETTTFRLDFQVPPAPAYEVRARAFGLRYRTRSNNFTLNGLQLLGERRIEIPALSQQTAVITLEDAVPRVTIRNTGNGFELSWTPVPFASGYSVLSLSDGTPVDTLATNTPDLFFVSSDPDLDGFSFRVRAEFGARGSGAYGEESSVFLSPPMISSLVPNWVNAGGTLPLDVSIRGRGFGVFGASVGWNNELLPPESVSDTLIRITLEPSRFAEPTTHSVKIVNPDGQESGTLPFYVVPGSIAPPELISHSPDSAYARGPSFTLRVDGQGFGSGATVLWETTPLTTSAVAGNPSRQLDAFVPFHLLRDSGLVNVRVRNSDGSTSGSLPFTRLPSPWRTRGSLAVPREYPRCFSIGRQIYALGGQSLTATGFRAVCDLDSHDPATDRWTSRQPMLDHCGTVVAVAISDRILVLDALHRGFDVFFVLNNQWVAQDSLFGPGLESFRPVAVDDVVYLLYSSAGIYRMDPDTYVATRLRNFTPPSRSAYSTAVLGGEIYFVGGLVGGVHVATVESYDPITGVWRTRASLPFECTGPITAMNGRLYFLSDCRSGSPLLAYSPVDDAWRVESYPANPRPQSGLIGHEGTLYMIGGNEGLSVTDVDSYAPPSYIPR